MATGDPLHGKGPVFRTLREISKLPAEQQLNALIDRLDMLDQDELEKVTMNKNGDEYSVTSNKVRLSILEVAKKWFDEEQAKGNTAGVGKLAGLGVFRKAG